MHAEFVRAWPSAAPPLLQRPATTDSLTWQAIDGS